MSDFYGVTRLENGTFPEAGFKPNMAAKIKLEAHRLASGKISA
jgi:hypothetical protein